MRKGKDQTILPSFSSPHQILLGRLAKKRKRKVYPVVNAKRYTSEDDFKPARREAAGFYFGFFLLLLWRIVRLAGLGEKLFSIFLASNKFLKLLFKKIFLLQKFYKGFYFGLIFFQFF